jgi:hypothetical protein
MNFCFNPHLRFLMFKIYVITDSPEESNVFAALVDLLYRELTSFFNKLICAGYPHNTYHGPVRHHRPLLNNLVVQGQEPHYIPSGNEEDVRPLHSQLSALKLSRSGSQGGSVTGSRTVSCSSSRAGSPCRKNSFSNEFPEVS